MNLLDRLRIAGRTRSWSDNTWLVVGLGNPGTPLRRQPPQRRPDGRRRARGAHRREASRATRRPRAWPRAFLGPAGAKLILAKPNGYMNVSGGPVSALLKFYGSASTAWSSCTTSSTSRSTPSSLKLGGGHGGHNGLRDVQKAAGSPDFPRVRVGIGRPPGAWTPRTACCATFAGAEREALPNLLADAADAVEAIVDDGLVAAQQAVPLARLSGAGRSGRGGTPRVSAGRAGALDEPGVLPSVSSSESVGPVGGGSSSRTARRPRPAVVGGARARRSTCSTSSIGRRQRRGSPSVAPSRARAVQPGPAGCRRPSVGERHRAGALVGGLVHGVPGVPAHHCGGSGGRAAPRRATA